MSCIAAFQQCYSLSNQPMLQDSHSSDHLHRNQGSQETDNNNNNLACIAPVYQRFQRRWDTPAAWQGPVSGDMKGSTLESEVG